MEFVAYDDTIVYYESVGSGSPILFIHPPGLGRRVFDYQKRLSNQYHLLIPDFSGHGNSVSPLSDDIVKQYVVEINHILRKENIDQVVICAYSAGGTIAQTFVHFYPEKVRGLVISGAYPKVDSKGLDFMYKFGFYMLKKNPEILAEILAFSNSRNKVYRDILFHHTTKSKVEHWYAFYKDTYYYDITHWTDHIKCPCLLAYGQRAYWVHNHKKYYQANPYVKVAFVRNAFHQLPTKNWQAFNHLINQFMRSL